MNTPKRAKLMMLFAMISFGTLAPFVRNIPVASGELALYRAVLAAALIGFILLLQGQRLSLRCLGKQLYPLILSGVAMGFNWIFLFEAYQYTTVAISTMSYYFAPVIITVVSPFLFRERITARQLLCFVMSTAGLLLIIGITDIRSSDSNAIGIAFGLGAAVLYAAVILLNKFITGVTGLHRTLLQFLSAILVLTPYVAMTSGFHLHTLDCTGWVCLLIVGLVHTGITYCLYFSSLKSLTGQEAAILSYIDPLVAVIIGVLILKEPLSWQQMVGGSMILGFTLWSELGSVK